MKTRREKRWGARFGTVGAVLVLTAIAAWVRPSKPNDVAVEAEKATAVVESANDVSNGAEVAPVEAVLGSVESVSVLTPEAEAELSAPASLEVTVTERVSGLPADGLIATLIMRSPDGKLRQPRLVVGDGHFRKQIPAGSLLRRIVLSPEGDDPQGDLLSETSFAIGHTFGGGEELSLTLDWEAGFVLEGVVVDRKTGESVEGATVLALPSLEDFLECADITDTSGRFRICGLGAGALDESGAIDVDVRLAGWPNKHFKIDVPQGVTERVGIRLEIDRGWWVEGFVEDASGEPVAGRTVDAYRPLEIESNTVGLRLREATARTSETGHLQIGPVTLGQPLVLVLDRDGHRPVVLQLEPEQLREPLRWVVADNLSVDVQIRDGHGHPVGPERAFVTAKSEDGAWWPGSFVDGQFRFPFPGAQSVTIRAVAIDGSGKVLDGETQAVVGRGPVHLRVDPRFDVHEPVETLQDLAHLLENSVGTVVRFVDEEGERCTPTVIQSHGNSWGGGWSSAPSFERYESGEVHFLVPFATGLFDVSVPGYRSLTIEVTSGGTAPLEVALSQVVRERQ